MTQDLQNLFRIFDFDHPDDVRQWSQCAAVSLQTRLRATWQQLERNGIDPRVIDRRVEIFRDLLQRLTPHWLTEAENIAAGVDVKADEILMLNCLPASAASNGGGCTSFIQIGTEKNRLLKIRDERNRDQYAMIRRVRRQWFHAAADIGNLGYAHLLRADGLAGGNNTGSPVDGITDDPGLNDCHVLRYIAENTKAVADIPDCFESLMAAGALAGIGGNRGGILLFCDRQRGVIIEYTPEQYAVQFIDSGTIVRSNHFLTRQTLDWSTAKPDLNTRRRYERMCQLLGDGRWLETQKLFAVVRDRKHHPHSLCNDDTRHAWTTVSVQIAEMDHNRRDQGMNYICCGNPCFSPFIPVPIHQQASFIPLASGQYYRRSNDRYRQRSRFGEYLSRLRQLESNSLTHPDYTMSCQTVL